MADENCSDAGTDPNPCFLQKFRLYETRSNFYMIGRDKNRAFWRLLKIDRLDPSELTILEDSTTYSEIECCDLLRRIHEGNRSTGGLKFVTACYGIVGFVKFLGPYYMLLITKRRKIGAICGHTIYAITKSEMIPIPNSPVQSNVAYSKDEKRSFVNSACKCNVSLVLIRRHMRLALLIFIVHLYLDGIVLCCGYFIFFSITYVLWDNNLSSGVLF
ncbi:SAC domain - like 4 [Theobroma cacao]|nr:SAC domain - like 4 [Theobroma cacao]